MAGMRDAIAQLFGLLIVFTATAGASAQQFISSNGMKLTIAHDAISAYETPLWVAIERGLFRKYGIDATTEAITPSPTLIASMLSGETPVAIAAESAVINADLSGGDLVYLTTGVQKLFFELYASPDIHSVAELKGKRIGVTQFGSTTDFIARYILTNSGLNPASDTIIVPMGTQQNARLAMLGGRLDAAILGAEIILQSKELGPTKSVANMFDYNLLFYTGGIVAKRSWINEHRNDALNVVRGYLEGVATVYSDKSAAIAAIKKYLRIDNANALDQNYAMLITVLSKDQRPRAEGIQTGLKVSKLAAAKTANPNDFIDPSFVAALEQEGFTDSIYREAKPH